MAVNAFIGAIVQRGIESAIDSLFGTRDDREAGRQPLFGELPERSEAFNIMDDTTPSELLTQFANDKASTQTPDVPPGTAFIDDPLLAKLASGERIEPIDFLRK